MKKTLTIDERITVALRGGPLSTLNLAEVLWPLTKYPDAWRYSSNGGPPGWVMPLGKAIKRMGLYTERRECGRKFVYPKRKETK